MTSPLNIIAQNTEPIRLDSYLATQVGISRSQIARWIDDGYVAITREGKSLEVKAALILKASDHIQVYSPPIQPSVLLPEKIPLEILYEDSDILVINKSSNMTVHPGAGNKTGTLVHALLHHCKGLSQIGGVERPGIVHRLDKGTSGVMVIAKNDESHQNLSEQFKNHEIKKIYRALVYGVPKKSSHTINTMIARSPDNRKKYAVTTNGRRAITHYRVLKSGHGLSEVEIDLETGRTHQIRVHMTHLGHSLVGDPLYGGNDKKIKALKDEGLVNLIKKCDHPLLHSYSLTLMHPKTKKTMTWTAELPEDFRTILNFI